MTPAETRSFRDVVRARTPIIGTFLNLGSTLAAEACALAGYDWLLVDLEHGGRGEDGVIGQLLAGAAHDVPVLVRVESDRRIRAGRILDAGAAGVMFPRLESVAEVEAAMRHLRYPPSGDRGVATYNRSIGFGLLPDRLDTANDQIVGIVQIESLEALDAVEAIARVPGVDVVFVGPRDLTQAMGISGRLDHPTFREALGRVAQAAADAGIGAGILAGSVETATGFVADGYTFIGVGSDSTTLATVGQRTVQDFRASLATDPSGDTAARA